jgi:hypothetical protein
MEQGSYSPLSLSGAAALTPGLIYIDICIFNHLHKPHWKFYHETNKCYGKHLSVLSPDDASFFQVMRLQSHAAAWYLRL